MKGVIKPDHIPLNKYELMIAGAPPLIIVELGDLEDELETADLPDRTRASGGNRKASEFTISIPMHHTLARNYCELWFREAQDPVSPAYKKPGMIVWTSGTRIQRVMYTLIGVFLTKRSLPGGEMANEGEQANIEYAVSVDEILPM